MRHILIKTGDNVFALYIYVQCSISVELYQQILLQNKIRFLEQFFGSLSFLESDMTMTKPKFKLTFKENARYLRSIIA